MWKIAVGFALFAALSIFVIIKAGDNADMGGEKHGADSVHVPEPSAAASPGCQCALMQPGRAVCAARITWITQ
jgi:hypothetical protein